MRPPVLTDEILTLDCELNVYRKGSLTVSLDLRQGIMVWRESRQWCNNFVRTLSVDQLRRLRNLIQPLDMAGRGAVEDEAAADESGEMTERSSLKLTAAYAERRLCLSGDTVDPECWAALRREIESLSRVPFQL